MTAREALAREMMEAWARVDGAPGYHQRIADAAATIALRRENEALERAAARAEEVWSHCLNGKQMADAIRAMKQEG